MLNPICLNTPIQFKQQAVKTRQAEKPVQQADEKNPISRTGETLKLIKTTFVAGIIAAFTLLGDMLEVGFELGDGIIEGVDALINKAKKENKIIDQKEIDKIKKQAEEKAKKIKDRKLLRNIGAAVALATATICGFAALYTLYNAPKISYEGKVNKFKKGQEMDVYIKANEAEKKLYTELDERAQNSSAEGKEQLKEQYLQMRNAKNKVPDFVQIKEKHNK